MSAGWPLAPLLLVRTRDEVSAAATLAEACVAERAREAEHATVAIALAACAAERMQSAPGNLERTAEGLQRAARHADALRAQEMALASALASAAEAREKASERTAAARRALAAARRARDLLEGRRQAFLREGRERREEHEVADHPWRVRVGT